MNPQRYGFETRMIHAGAQPEPITGARQTPIYQNSSYVFHDSAQAAALFNLQDFGFLYSRLTNPTVAVLEQRLASLDGGRGATCTASGHAAQLLTLFALMSPGDHLVAARQLYGGSITQFGKTFAKFDWHCSFVDVHDPASVRAAITPRTKALFAESIANPLGDVTDIAALAGIAQGAGIPLIIDNTLATPALIQPLAQGADLVVYSTTKFLSGQGAAMGGAVVDSGRFDWRAQPERFPALAQPEPAYHGLTFAESFGDLAFTLYCHAVGLRDLGACQSPQNAFLTLLGIETLSLRMDRHCDNALGVAQFLASHPAVASVSYAGLPEHPRHRLIGPRAGAVFSFEIRGGEAAAQRLVAGLNLFSHLANVGDARSLVLHPASTTHRQLSPEQRAAAGAGDAVIRLSIGLETLADLTADLDQALKAAVS